MSGHDQDRENRRSEACALIIPCGRTFPQVRGLPGPLIEFVLVRALRLGLSAFPQVRAL
jgi:hypothetical protein